MREPIFFGNITTSLRTLHIDLSPFSLNNVTFLRTLIITMAPSPINKKESLPTHSRATPHCTHYTIKAL